MLERGFYRSFLLLFAVLLIPAFSVAAGKCERLVATGNPEYPPYLWRDPQNPQQLIGANADLLKQLAKELGLVVDVIYTGPWSRAQDEVRTGRVDLIAGAFLTLPRLDVMDYVHPAFYSTPNVVWVHRGAEFLTVHLEIAIARETDDGAVGMGDLGCNGGGQIGRALEADAGLFGGQVTQGQGVSAACLFQIRLTGHATFDLFFNAVHQVLVIFQVVF